MKNLNITYEKNKYSKASSEQAKLLGDKFVGIGESNKGATKVNMKYKAGPIKTQAPMKEEVEVITEDFKVKIVGLIARRENVVIKKQVEPKKRTFRGMF